jgi:NhaA family Na+:H+ antiporter
VVPVVAAVGGMAVPAGIYVAINVSRPDGAMSGWAIPVATDIAFAVAVLAAFGKSLPTALRAFLLTLAVADDLLGIVVIAIFYAQGMNWGFLAGAVAAVAAYGLLVRLRRPPAVVLVALGVVAWYFMHASGVHATIAGVLLGFATPALPLARQRPREQGQARAERYEHIWRPISAGLVVPIFALFAAGVELSPAALSQAVVNPAAQGVALGLVFGKPIGIVATTWLLVRLTKATLDQAVRWADLIAVGCVAGIGFTVSLLIGKLAFPPDSVHEQAIKAAVLIGSLTAAVIGAVALRLRSRHHTSLALLEEAAADAGDIDLESPAS